MTARKPKKPKRKPVCTKCGVCCLAYNEQDVFCNLLEEDLPKIPKRYCHFVRYENIVFGPVCRELYGANRYPPMALATKTLKPKSGPLKGFTLCACALLRGVPLEKVWCAIYEHRPHVCHEAVEPGDASCRWWRMQVEDALKGLSRVGE